ncbi:MAG: energy transducer TonB [Acidobacteriota bacterium]|nr:energy transducer TonB [Acidobacteriota bacterium]
MAKQVLSSHVREEGYTLSYVASVVSHVSLFLIFALAVEFLPAGNPVAIGTGTGGGQGNDFVTVGLFAEADGGTGMYKPAIVSRPEAVPPSPVEEPASISKETFAQRGTPKRTPPPSQPPTPSPGAIPQEPEPGSGGASGANPGSGGGFGGGQGVTIGSGTGQGAMDSWYVRQVEQRVGQNWLKTSLGQLERPVQTVISFEINRNGNIESIQIEQRSGIRSVDLAAERAIQASGPLPPLPFEFRQQKVKFVAHFEYPPK